MINSMSGFGKACAVYDDNEITVEVRSINHRYFEFSCKSSKGYTFIDTKLKSHINKYLSRGKVDVFVNIKPIGDIVSSVQVNYTLAEEYAKAIKELSNRCDLSNNISVADLISIPEMIDIIDVEIDEQLITNEIIDVVDEAVYKLMEMRKLEGEQLYNDIQQKKSSILKKVEQIEQLSPKCVDEYYNKLKSKLAEILASKDIDESRILTEAAIFADKIAVDEETVRLRSHISQMDNLLELNEPVGRRLDFLVQEMNREINTIGSKSPNSQIAHIVVEIKGEIEKIREQIQNIE